MIQFPCKCSYKFEVPQDMAGGMIQCPNCGLLADVPLLSDLPTLNNDGTFGFTDNLPPKQDPSQIYLSFVDKTTDFHGQQKDLRRSVEDFQTVSLQEQIAPRVAPRYDPVTGELIRPLQFKEETPVPVISIGEAVDPDTVDDETEDAVQAVVPLPVLSTASPRALGYAIGDARKHVTLKTLAIELLMPANITVMFFVYLLYILGFYVAYGITNYISDLSPFLLLNFPMLMVIAHVGCAIETTGPDAVDELPRPLREFSLDEDILAPLFRAALAGLICFAPLMMAIHYLNRFNPATLPLILLLGVFGTVLLPAVLLTAITGTTVLNLRPDRVAAVMRLCGGIYLISILLFLLALVPSLFYLAGQFLLRNHLDDPLVTNLERRTVMFPVMALSVYLLHFFCWHLGMMYREHHDHFPWLAQRHIKKAKAENASTV